MCATPTRTHANGPGVDEPLIWYEGSSTASGQNWLIADRQGSIIATTDSTGAATTYAYDPYGRPREWSGPRFRYTGQAALPELRLYHYKARVYLPELGRFAQTDPVGYEEDLNLYAYVRNDPLNFADSTGRRAYLVSRRIFTEAQARSAGFAAATATMAATGGDVTAASAAYYRAYSEAINTKHAFLVVTVGDTTIEQGQIDQTYSYGPGDERGARAPLGHTSLQVNTKTARDDQLALDSIAAGNPDAGVDYSEIEGLRNADARAIFGAPSERRVYAPVPSVIPGSTNSNAEAFARASAAATRAGSRLRAPNGGHPGAGQAERVVCPNEQGGDTC